MITEDQLEQLCLGWFRDGGWETVFGPDIAPDGAAPERTNYREGVLVGRLTPSLARLNPGVPATVIDEAVQRRPFLRKSATSSVFSRFPRLPSVVRG